MTSTLQAAKDFERRARAVTHAPASKALELFHAAELDITSDLRYFDWGGICFDGCDLKGCDFTGARLSGCTFRRAKISGAIFDSETLESGILSQAEDFESYNRPVRDRAFFSAAFLAMKNKGQKKRFIDKYGQRSIFVSADHINHHLRDLPLFEEAVASLGLFTEFQIAPSAETFDILGHLAEASGKRENNHAKVQQVIELAKQWQVRPSAQLYARSIGTAQSYSDAKMLMREMEDTGIEVTAYSYARMIRLAPDFSSALADFKELNYRRKILPTEEVFVAMIVAAKELRDAWFNLNQIKKRNLQYTAEPFNAVLEKIFPSRNRSNKKPLEAANKVLDRMRRENVSPNSQTYEQLIRLSNDFKTVSDFLWEMRRLRMPPTMALTAHAAQKIRNLDEATRLRNIFAPRINLPTAFFEAVYNRVVPWVDADELLGWAYSNRGDSDRPHDSAWEVAISRYHRAQKNRFPQAIRIAYAFPFLDASKELFLAYPDQSIHYLEDRFSQGKEPHYAANALGVISEIHGDMDMALKWFETALKTGGMTKAREKNVKESVQRVKQQL